MPQYLRNETLVWTNGQTDSLFWRTDDLSSVKKVDIQHPDGWRYIHQSFYKQAERVAQSLHDDAGFKIATGYQKFRAGYEQSAVDIPGGVRYLLRVEYDLLGSEGVGDVEVKLRVVGEDIVDSGWSPAAGSREKLLVFRAIRSGLVNVQVMFQNERHEGTVCDILVRRVTLETVADDYGGNLVPTLLPLSDAAPQTPPPQTPPPPVSVPPAGVLTINLNVTINVPQALVGVLELWIAAWSKDRGLVG